MKPFLFTLLSPLLFLVLTAQGKDQPNVLFIGKRSPRFPLKVLD